MNVAFSVEVGCVRAGRLRTVGGNQDSVHRAGSRQLPDPTIPPAAQRLSTAVRFGGTLWGTRHWRSTLALVTMAMASLESLSAMARTAGATPSGGSFALASLTAATAALVGGGGRPRQAHGSVSEERHGRTLSPTVTHGAATLPGRSAWPGARQRQLMQPLPPAAHGADAFYNGFVQDDTVGAAKAARSVTVVGMR